MPPRLNLLARAAQPQSHTSVASFLAPFLRQAQHQQQQQRSASILSTLSDTDGAYNKRIRRGRGASSGKGKTSGRGHKGQKQHGKVPRNFNGGQTPEVVVHGERGFENHFSVDMSPVNLDRIAHWVSQGRLDPTKPITLKELCASRCLHGIKDGVKLLARNTTAAESPISVPINIVVSRASASAIAAVEKAGGTVTTRYYTRPAISRILKGETDPINSLLSKKSEAEEAAAATKNYRYRLPDPASRKDLEYYRDPAHRGYLSHLVAEGHGPSLFFKTPGLGRADRAKMTSKGGKVVGKSENRVW
ncbi:hypothetical protein AAFC00_000074 [Neodothiora populina]|uniref:Large ribosomal subunit protein uL15/eL18 domain-containing protein n=1 Tax=Neodothiora populina TaxID=2781224 RepID=A0ABR3P1A0_9PEZI